MSESIGSSRGVSVPLSDFSLPVLSPRYAFCAWQSVRFVALARDPLRRRLPEHCGRQVGRQLADDDLEALTGCSALVARLVRCHSALCSRAKPQPSLRGERALCVGSSQLKTLVSRQLYSLHSVFSTLVNMREQVQSHGPRCLLLELPPELLVAICARSDFPSLSALIRSHSQLKAIWDMHAERIARAICIRHRLADPQSCSAARPLDNFVGTELPHPETGLDALELASVVKSQRWMHDSAGISSWVDYARVRHVIHRNWLAGHAQVRYLRLNFAPPSLAPFQPMLARQDHIWRFKLDPEPGYIVATGRIFGVHAFRASDGVRVWENTTPFVPYAHVELSEGHFATASGDMRHALWRRDDLDADFDPGSVGPDRPLEYTLTKYLNPNAPCSATKMRWPYFVAVSSNSDHVFCYDLSRSPVELVTHRMTAFWEPEAAGGLGEENVHYVEIDARAIYLAGKKSVSLWRYDEPEEPHIVWPPDPPAPAPDPNVLAADADVGMAASSSTTGSPPPQHRTHYRSSDLDGFSAVHHDGCGQHLVGIAGETGAQMRLYWTCDYLTTLWSGDCALLERKTVVLTTPTLPVSCLSLFVPFVDR